MYKIVEGLKFSVQAVTYQVQLVDHVLLSSFSHKHILRKNSLHRCEDKVTYRVSCLSEMLAHWEVGLVMAGLNNSVPVPHKPLLSSFASLPTILRIVRAGPVTLLAGPYVDDVGSGAGDVALDSHVLSCAADLHRL